jgi:O-antigen/teichoic acid export membrane protein
MGIMDLGIRASTGRYIVYYLGKNDYGRIDETIRTGLGLYLVLSIFIIAAGFFLGVFFPDIFQSVPEKYYNLIKILFPVLAVNIWFSAVSSILSSILGAHERFDLARSSDLIMLAVRTLITIIVIELDMGIAGLTTAVVFSNIFCMASNWFFASKIHKDLKLVPLLFKKERIKELYNYGIGAFIIAASIRILGQTDLFLAGVLINVNSVAVYSVGAMLIFYSNTFLLQINKTFFPSLQKAVVSENLSETRLIIERTLRATLTIGLLIYGGCFFFGREFISLWMFDLETFSYESVYRASQVMAVLACAKLLLVLGSFSRNLLAASGHIGFSALTSIVEAVFNLFLSVILVTVFNLGLTGIAAGTLISHLIIQSVFLPFYACKKAGIDWLELISDFLFKGILSGCVLAVACTLIKTLYSADTWFSFFTQVTAVVLIYSITAFIFLITKEERQSLKRIIPFLKPKNNFS